MAQIIGRSTVPAIGTTFCSVTESDGAECYATVAEGAPYDLCPKHMEAVFTWWSRNGSRTDAKPLGHPCPLCGSLRVFPGATGWWCTHCSATSDAFKPQGSAITEADMNAFPAYREDLQVRVVYYVRFRDLVKIGTTRNMRSRITSLLHDELLAVEQGSYDLESRRHEQFAADRFQGEWFNHSKRLDQHIKHLRAGVTDPWAQVEFWERRRRAEAEAKSA